MDDAAKRQTSMEKASSAVNPSERSHCSDCCANNKHLRRHIKWPKSNKQTAYEGSMKLRLTPYLFICGISISFLAGSPVFAKTPTSFEWKPECVGRLNVSLPGEVDVAGYSFTKLIQELDIRGGQQQFQFSDGQEAGWSHLQYDGVLYVSNAITPIEYAVLDKKIIKRMEKNRMAAQKNKASDGSPLVFSMLDIKSQEGRAWGVSEYYTAFFKLKDHVFFFDLGGRKEDATDNRNLLSTIIGGLSYRPLYSVPNQIGVCLPYSFIKDNGEHRRIAMTYRLKSHPDITILLDDSNAKSYDNPIRAENAEPKNRLNDFWGQYELSATGKQVESIWRFPSARPVKIAGQNGLASFVKITRKNNSVDYGYLAVVRGDPDAKTDTPDLRFYVIREADHAKAKGFEPVNEKDFLEMAQAIAASIKHRPTK